MAELLQNLTVDRETTTKPQQPPLKPNLLDGKTKSLQKVRQNKCLAHSILQTWQIKMFTTAIAYPGFFRTRSIKVCLIDRLKGYPSKVILHT